MRIPWLPLMFALAPGLLVATTGACGGLDRPNDSTAPTCGHGPNLVLRTSSVMVAPADLGMVQGMLAVAELSPLIATTDGKTVLATWTATDASGITQGHVVVSRLGANGVVDTSAPVDAPTIGVAAFDGTSFLVVGRTPGPPPLPNAPTSLQLQRVALDGSAVGAPQTIQSMPGPGAPTSAVWTPRGLAVAWWAFGAQQEQPTTAVQLFGADGRLLRSVALDAVSNDPSTDLQELTPPAVALLNGQLVVAYGHTVSTLDWLGGSAQSSQTGFAVSVPERGGFPTLFETGGKLRVWGLGPTDEAGSSYGVYAGGPGASFADVGSVEISAVTQQPDGCGGAVTLSDRDMALSVVSDTAPGRIVSLGTTPRIAGQMASMIATPSGFAVAWVADDGMHLATLAWE